MWTRKSPLADAARRRRRQLPDGAPPLALLPTTRPRKTVAAPRGPDHAEAPGRIRVLSEDEFCRMAGQPTVAERRTQHYGQRDIL